MNMITMASPHFTQEDRVRFHREVELILDGALSMGPNVQLFEREFAERIGVKHAIATNSCTSALEIALQSKNVKGMEVILPAETFIATGMAVHLSGGIPIFAEISASTLCLDIDDVKRKVTKNTAGVIIVHMAGLISPDILALKNFCNKKNLFLIEDAAHSPGANLDGLQAGSIGNVGCFSFYPTKVITSGEGGMLTTNDDGVAEIARSSQMRGLDLRSSREQYSMEGRNVRMTEITALLGRIQLSHLDEFLHRRREIAKIYYDELANVKGITVIFPKQIEGSSFWKIPILMESHIDRDLIQQEMQEAKIATDFSYQPALHLQPFFQSHYGTKEGLLPATEDILSRHMCLPCHPRMSDDDVFYAANTFKNLIKKYS